MTLGADISLHLLQKFNVIYLSSPYSKYPLGTDRAFLDACTLTARLLKNKVSVFSPVAHFHPVAYFGEMDPTDDEIWLKIDLAFLRKCDAIVVAKMPGWENSHGVSEELKHAGENNIPVFFIDPNSLLVTENLYAKQRIMH